MNQDLLNILSHSNKDIDNQKLMDYLSGKLSEEDRHEVESWMNNNEFAAEAMEGLEQFGQNTRLESYVADLNKDLNRYLREKKTRRERRRIKEVNWVLVTVITILLLIILAYLVLSRMGIT